MALMVVTCTSFGVRTTSKASEKKSRWLGTSGTQGIISLSSRFLRDKIFLWGMDLKAALNEDRRRPCFKGEKGGIKMRDTEMRHDIYKAPRAGRKRKERKVHQKD
ncbi:hypothetical protein ACLOJK_033453 [Asimina triloba]